MGTIDLLPDRDSVSGTTPILDQVVSINPELLEDDLSKRLVVIDCSDESWYYLVLIR